MVDVIWDMETGDPDDYNESIGEWAEVELYREKGQWGSRLAPGSGVHIITGYDRAKFVATLTATSA